MRIKQKIGIITGAGNGIGRGICKKFAEEGGIIAAVDIDLDSAEKIVEEINNNGGESIAIQCDVTSKKDVINMVQDVVNKYSYIDILVNSAGIDIKGKIEEITEEVWDNILTLNLKGTFLTTQAIVKEMKKRQYGRIINISSIAGKTGEPFSSPYCSSKFGVIGFTQAIALELGKDNITVNAVCPGPVETSLITKSVSQTAKLNNRSFEEEMYEKFIRFIPLGRIAKVEDVANAALFLASDEASYITGITLNVSGGKEMH